MKIKFQDNNTITVPYNKETHLPVLPAFRNTIDTAKSLALTGLVTDESNQNLTFLRKWILKYHWKLGHVGFSCLQWIGRQGWLGAIRKNLREPNVEPPKCAACLFGKKERNPKAASKTLHDKDKQGILKQGKLNPGELIFSDQY